jgi:hypothetical protein
VEAIEAFGDRLDKKDLYWAYRQVGKSFKGQLEGLFLVLNEAGRANNVNQSPPPSARVGRPGLQEEVRLTGQRLVD